MDDQQMRAEIMAEVQQLLQQQQQNVGIAEIAAAVQRPQRRRVKPPTFNGTDDIRQFLRLFDTVTEANGWDDDERTLHLQLALEGGARACIVGETYQEMVDALLARYEVTQDQACRSLRNAKLRPGENIYQFGEFLTRMVALAHPNLTPENREEMAIRE